MLRFLVAALAAMLAFTPVAASAQGNLAPGQSKADYYAWLARSPEHVGQVRAFREHLVQRDVEDIVPVWQLIRTSSSWRECGAERFDVAPADKWDHIVTTLAFVRDEVRPPSARSRRSPPIATSISTAARTAPRRAPTACSSRSI